MKGKQKYHDIATSKNDTSGPCRSQIPVVIAVVDDGDVRVLEPPSQRA